MSVASEAAPPCGRPPRRLLAAPGAELSDAELLAKVLSDGRGGRSVSALARDLITRQGGLANLAEQGTEALRWSGLRQRQARRFHAAAELGRRLARGDLERRQPFAHPDAVARYVASTYLSRGQEVMGALYLDTEHRLMADGEIYRGTMSCTAVEPRGLLKAGLLYDAAAFIVFHTHPSNNPTPSQPDLTFTRRLADAAAVVGVALLDHVIVGSAGRWVSLSRSNPLYLRARDL